MSLIIGAMRDRLILVRGLFARDGQASYQIIQSWAGPAELDVASGVPDIPGGLSRVSRYPLIRLVLFLRAWLIIAPWKRAIPRCWLRSIWNRRVTPTPLRSARADVTDLPPDLP